MSTLAEVYLLDFVSRSAAETHTSIDKLDELLVMNYTIAGISVSLMGSDVASLKKEVLLVLYSLLKERIFNDKNVADTRNLLIQYTFMKAIQFVQTYCINGDIVFGQFMFRKNDKVVLVTEKESVDKENVDSQLWEEAIDLFVELDAEDFSVPIIRQLVGMNVFPLGILNGEYGRKEEFKGAMFQNIKNIENLHEECRKKLIIIYELCIWENAQVIFKISIPSLRIFHAIVGRKLNQARSQCYSEIIGKWNDYKPTQESFKLETSHEVVAKTVTSDPRFAPYIFKIPTSLTIFCMEKNEEVEIFPLIFKEVINLHQLLPQFKIILDNLDKFSSKLEISCSPLKWGYRAWSKQYNIKSMPVDLGFHSSNTIATSLCLRIICVLDPGILRQALKKLSFLYWQKWFKTLNPLPFKIRKNVCQEGHAFVQYILENEMFDCIREKIDRKPCVSFDKAKPSFDLLFHVKFDDPILNPPELRSSLFGKPTVSDLKDIVERMIYLTEEMTRSKKKAKFDPRILQKEQDQAVSLKLISPTDDVKSFIINGVKEYDYFLVDSEGFNDFRALFALVESLLSFKKIAILTRCKLQVKRTVELLSGCVKDRSICFVDYSNEHSIFSIPEKLICVMTYDFALRDASDFFNDAVDLVLMDSWNFNDVSARMAYIASTQLRAKANKSFAKIVIICSEKWKIFLSKDISKYWLSYSGMPSACKDVSIKPSTIPNENVPIENLVKTISQLFPSFEGTFMTTLCVMDTLEDAQALYVQFENCTLFKTILFKNDSTASQMLELMKKKINCDVLVISPWSIAQSLKIYKVSYLFLPKYVTQKRFNFDTGCLDDVTCILSNDDYDQFVIPMIKAIANINRIYFICGENQGTKQIQPDNFMSDSPERILCHIFSQTKRPDDDYIFRLISKISDDLNFSQCLNEVACRLFSAELIQESNSNPFRIINASNSHLQWTMMFPLDPHICRPITLALLFRCAQPVIVILAWNQCISSRGSLYSQVVDNVSADEADLCLKELCSLTLLEIADTYENWKSSGEIQVPIGCVDLTIEYIKQAFNQMQKIESAWKKIFFDTFIHRFLWLTPSRNIVNPEEFFNANSENSELVIGIVFNALFPKCAFTAMSEHSWVPFFDNEAERNRKSFTVFQDSFTFKDKVMFANPSPISIKSIAWFIPRDLYSTYVNGQVNISVVLFPSATITMDAYSLCMWKYIKQFINHDLWLFLANEQSSVISILFELWERVKNIVTKCIE